MAKYRVLVIDDAKYVFKAVKAALEPLGFEIAGFAENGKIGIEMYDILLPDIVTLDITMPVMDGIKTAAELNRRVPRPGIIMMSAMTNDKLRKSAMDAGVRYFVSKPFKAENLVSIAMECIVDK